MATLIVFVGAYKGTLTRLSLGGVRGVNAIITALIHRDHISITVFVLLALLCCCLVMAQTLRALANSDIIVLILASIS